MNSVDPHFLWTDGINSENLLARVKDFLNEFSELKGRLFYISGESSEGVYILLLSSHILEDTSFDKVNLKGVLNGLTDFDSDVERSMVNLGFYHVLISLETYNNFKRNCPHVLDELYPEEYDEDSQKTNDNHYPRNIAHKSNEIRNVIRKNLGGSDIHNIYGPYPSEIKFSLNDPFYLNSKYNTKKIILEKLHQYNKKII